MFLAIAIKFPFTRFTKQAAFYGKLIIFLTMNFDVTPLPLNNKGEFKEKRKYLYQDKQLYFINLDAGLWNNKIHGN